MLALLFFLVAAHALMDYALQSETIATCKCRGCDSPVAKNVPWYYWLTAHTLLHGAAVGARRICGFLRSAARLHLGMFPVVRPRSKN